MGLDRLSGASNDTFIDSRNGYDMVGPRLSDSDSVSLLSGIAMGLGAKSDRDRVALNVTRRVKKLSFKGSLPIAASPFPAVHICAL